MVIKIHSSSGSDSSSSELCCFSKCFFSVGRLWSSPRFVSHTLIYTRRLGRVLCVPPSSTTNRPSSTVTMTMTTTTATKCQRQQSPLSSDRGYVSVRLQSPESSNNTHITAVIISSRVQMNVRAHFRFVKKKQKQIERGREKTFWKL